MQIEFDPEKARLNPLNHEGVTFDEAKVVLLDPYALTREDADALGEIRFVTLGMGAKSRILVVVWTLRGDIPRLISVFKQYAEMDFSTAKRVKDVPALAKLQAAKGGKSRITMRVDNATLAVFKVQAEMTGGSYQTLMNEALAEFAQGRRLADVVRETIKQELHAV
jgi:uncharacterized DUF497 family protein